MHCTHSCGSLVKQFPISNDTDLTIYPRKHCRKQDAAAGGPGGCDDIASYFFSRNRVYIHLYLTPLSNQLRPPPHIMPRPQNASQDPNVPQSVAHLICVPQVPQMWHKMWHSSGRPPQAGLLHHTRWYCIILFSKWKFSLIVQGWLSNE